MYLAVDIDAFYCAVEQRENSSLRDKPFCVIQKHVVVSPSYAARRLGVKKLSTISDVRKRFPEMQFINGENLAKYKAAGIFIWRWLKDLVSSTVERGGMEELRFDLNPSIEASLTSRLKRMAQATKECGSLLDEAGNGPVLQLGNEKFKCDDFFFQFDGVTYPPNQSSFFATDSLEAYVAGHIACYLRDRMHLELGYSCTIGVASTQLLAKMICSLGKPHGVAVLIPGSEVDYLNPKHLNEIPGLGKATVAKLEQRFGEGVTVEALHKNSSYSEIPDIWDLSFGTDVTPLKDYTVPKQISVENTYRHLLRTPEPEINKLVSSLLTQFKTQLWDEGVQAWRAFPTNLRVSILLVGSPTRKSRSSKASLKSASSVELQLGNFHRQLFVTARDLLRRLTSDPVRMLNIALVLEPNPEIMEV